MSSRVKRIKRKFFVAIINRFFCGTHFFEVKRQLLNCSGISIGKGTKVVGPFVVGNSSCVRIGENCWIGQNFQLHGDGEVYIGNNCDFGPAVGFFTGSHQIGKHDRRAGKGVSYSIRVGDGCWFGARSSILGDTTIEDGAIIAACALVKSDVKADTIVGGVPAHVIRAIE